jgi:hypothetical protein
MWGRSKGGVDLKLTDPKLAAIYSWPDPVMGRSQGCSDPKLGAIQSWSDPTFSFLVYTTKLISLNNLL